MLKTLLAHLRSYRQFAVFGSLIFASSLCIFILALRVAHTHTFTFSFLAWNLFLAWLPLIAAFIAYKLHGKFLGPFRVVLLACMGVWLVFLPNAPYLITDLVHLVPRSDISFWFDLTMLVAFAVTGLLCGLVSIYLMQQVVLKIAGGVASWLFVLSVSALSSFGIYLGRFQHWNSWDVLHHPVSLLTAIADIFRHPIAHSQIFAFSGLFTLFLIASYVMLSALTGLPQENSE